MCNHNKTPLINCLSLRPEAWWPLVIFTLVVVPQNQHFQ